MFAFHSLPLPSPSNLPPLSHEIPHHRRQHRLQTHTSCCSCLALPILTDTQDKLLADVPGSQPALQPSEGGKGEQKGPDLPLPAGR